MTCAKSPVKLLLENNFVDKYFKPNSMEILKLRIKIFFSFYKYFN